jgi:hypothetical protein
VHVLGGATHNQPRGAVVSGGGPSWHKAMVEELCSIEENNTWDVADLPTGHRPIGLKWVFMAKKNESGRVIKHKAHFVAKGFMQRQGQNLRKYSPW